MKTETVLVVGGIGILGIVVWLIWKQRIGATTAPRSELTTSKPRGSSPADKIQDVEATVKSAISLGNTIKDAFFSSKKSMT